MNDIIEKENIENMIYEIRGKQVMLDSDLARLYHTETKRINEAVRNNPYKFPERFSWILSDEESDKFLVENFDQKKETRGGRYRKPRVFTEHGVAMLATILKTRVAINISIQIMDAFVSMRHYLNENKDIYKSINNINNKLVEHDEKFNLIFSSFKEKKNHLFFNGEVYDAYSLMIDIFNKSKEEIIIIDNYLDKNLLDILSKTNKKIKVITNKYNNEDYSKYIKQYNNLELVINDSFHDRFIIIDRKILYHSGASFKDLGKKCFAISEIDDNKCLNNLINRL